MHLYTKGGSHFHLSVPRETFELIKKGDNLIVPKQKWNSEGAIGEGGFGILIPHDNVDYPINVVALEILGTISEEDSDLESNGGENEESENEG
jgi:hypothetical protein